MQRQGVAQVSLYFRSCICVYIAIRKPKQYGGIMQVQAPKGQYRVIGLDHVDTLESPSGSLSKDFESFDEARDLADRMTEEYLWTYVYDDAGELLYEASSCREQAQQVEMLSQEPPEGSNGDPRRTPR